MAMKSKVGKAQRNALEQIIALSVENQIKLEALEQVLVKTNPMVHELYLGQIETLSKQKAVKLNLALTPIPKKS
jgi:hypothetical protein